MPVTVTTLRFKGAASVTKPTVYPANSSQPIPAGTLFIETDTGKVFSFNGTTWVPALNGEGMQEASSGFIKLITPNDSTDLSDGPTRGISFATAGALKIDDMAGNTTTIPSGALAAGAIHPIRAKRVYSTGTTAVSIVGYW